MTKKDIFDITRNLMLENRPPSSLVECSACHWQRYFTYFDPGCTNPRCLDLTATKK